MLSSVLYVSADKFKILQYVLIKKAVLFQENRTMPL